MSSTMDEKTSNSIPNVSAFLEQLAETVEGWAEGLGIESTYSDPVLEERDRNEWGQRLRDQTEDDLLNPVVSVLTARGRTDLAADLRTRFDGLCDQAMGYQERLEALEDHRHTHVQALVARYQEAFPDDPAQAQLWKAWQQKRGVWALRDKNEQPEETREYFAEEIDKVFSQEEGAKHRAREMVRRAAGALAEHLRLIAAVESDRVQATAPSAATKAVGVQNAGQNVERLLQPPEGDDPDEQLLAAARVDPQDTRVVIWDGYRIYVGGRDTQASRLFWLLHNRLGEPCPIHEVQRVVDQMDVSADFGASPADVRKARNRVAKAVAKLRSALRESDIHEWVTIQHEGGHNSGSYTMFRRRTRGK